MSIKEECQPCTGISLRKVYACYEQTSNEVGPTASRHDRVVAIKTGRNLETRNRSVYK